MRLWWYIANGRLNGPFEEERIIALLRQRTLAPSTLVWHSGMLDWEPLESDAALGRSVAAPPPVPSRTVGAMHSRERWRRVYKVLQGLWTMAALFIGYFAIGYPSGKPEFPELAPSGWMALSCFIFSIFFLWWVQRDEGNEGPGQWLPAICAVLVGWVAGAFIGDLGWPLYWIVAALVVGALAATTLIESRTFYVMLAPLSGLAALVLARQWFACKVAATCTAASELDTAMQVLLLLGISAQAFERTPRVAR